MKVESRKYRRKKNNQASTITVESGDTLSIASGATLSVAGTLTATGTQTLTAPVINNASGTELSEVVTATNVMTAAESGKTFYLSAAAGFLSTLPAPAAGLNYRFVVKTAPTGGAGYTISTPTPFANIIFGLVLASPTDDAGVLASAEDLITLVNDASLIGDYVDLRSDGTNWYVSGMVHVLEGITFTAAQ